MDWKDVGQFVGSAAPMLASLLLPGPIGNAAGALIASAFGCAPTPNAVQTAIASNPDAAVKLAQIEADKAVQLQTLLIEKAKAEIAAEVASTQAVNQTMQAEAASEHWPTYSWRPAIGFAFALGIVLSILVVFVAYGFLIVYGDPVGVQQLPGVLASVTGVLTPAAGVLGIASYFRGKMQADPNIPTDNRG